MIKFKNKILAGTGYRQQYKAFHPSREGFMEIDSSHKPDTLEDET
jgi:hypothetical protein